MGQNDRGAGQHTGYLLLTNLDIISLEKNTLVVKSARRVRMNGRYRLKIPVERGSGVFLCRVVACELLIERDEAGEQKPLYKASLEVSEPEDSSACGLQALLAYVPHVS